MTDFKLSSPPIDIRDLAERADAAIRNVLAALTPGFDLAGVYATIHRDNPETGARETLKIHEGRPYWSRVPSEADVREAVEIKRRYPYNCKLHPDMILEAKRLGLDFEDPVGPMDPTAEAM